MLLLISETRDHGSHFAKLEDVVKLIGVANVAIYALPFSPSLSQVLDTERGSNGTRLAGVRRADVQGALLMALAAMKKNVLRPLRR